MNSFVGAPLWDHAATKGPAIALECGAASLSWSQLASAVANLAAQIRSATEPGGRVALFLDDPMERLVGLFACAVSGRVAMVGDSAWGEAKRRSIVGETQAAMVLTRLDALSPRHAEDREESDTVDETQAFYIGFTSGSTGVPKAFRRAHRSWLSSFRLSGDYFGLSQADRVMIPGDLSHSLHLYGAAQAIHMGAQTTIARRFVPRSIVQAMVEGRSSVLYATPTQLQLICRSAHSDSVVLPDVARILVSGSKWRPENSDDVARAFPNARLYEFYGTSETSFIAASSPVDGTPAGSVGRVLPGVDIAIRDDAGNRLPCGQTGLIYVRSGQLFDGYEMGGDEETRWLEDWLTVGDRGYVDSGGFLFLAGRRKRMFVSAGVNVYAEEIEAILESHPFVSSAAAFGFTDALRGTRIVAAIKPLQPVGAEMLRAHCLRHLEPVKAPRRFHMVEDWPLTAGGKTDLHRLELMLRAREETK